MAKARWLLAVLIALPGIVFVMITAYLVSIPSSAQFHHLDSTEIALIETATFYVREFGVRNMRNPTSAEFETWIEAHDVEYPRFEGVGLTLLNAPFSRELIARLGQPPPNAFVLDYLDHGNWIDYASWYGDGKLAYIPDPEYFSPFSGKSQAIAVFSVPWITLFGVAFLVVPKRKKHAGRHGEFVI